MRSGERQPLLHDLDVTLCAPTVVLSAKGGDIGATATGAGAQGVFHADVRVISRLELSLDGKHPELLTSLAAGSGSHQVVALARHLGDPGPDPTVRVERHRLVSPGRVEERVVVSSTARHEIVTHLELAVGADLLPVEAVKAGRHGLATRPTVEPGSRLIWSTPDLDVVVHGPGSAAVTADDGGVFGWTVTVPPRSSAEVLLRVDVEDRGSVVSCAPAAPTWRRPVVQADDRRLCALLEQSLDDLHALRMTEVSRPGDVFLAAGSPWFFTLFGRDSIWAARMMLPLGTDLARGTLRVLAARQGGLEDPLAEEQPGKVLHELRRGTYDDESGLVLPPVYYGSVDATPLWVCLLHDAWRWGLAEQDVEDLLPSLEAALGWVRSSAEAGGGFLRYVDHSGTGLANQGWKDSGDAVRRADGTLAAAPVALAEVQGYAYEAAVSGAALLDAFGRPGANRWRAFAADLRHRFREHFWVSDDGGRFPAMALDGADHPADALTSNIGHLIFSGLLDDDETALAAQRLATPAMSSGFGLRTMAATNAGYSPMSYHCGSVWAHDTMIAVAGLLRRGHPGIAEVLIDGLLAASARFEGRLPELWSGDARTDVRVPVPYPAACRPQAWAAASSVALIAALLGVDPDVPGGTLAVDPVQPSPVGALSVCGLTVAGQPLDVAIDARGRLSGLDCRAGLRVV